MSPSTPRLTRRGAALLLAASTLSYGYVGAVTAMSSNPDTPTTCAVTTATPVCSVPLVEANQ